MTTDRYKKIFFFFNKNTEGEERRVKRKRKREDEGLEGPRHEEVRRERTKKKRMPLRQPVMQKSNKQRGGAPKAAHNAKRRERTPQRHPTHDKGKNIQDESHSGGSLR